MASSRQKQGKTSAKPLGPSGPWGTPPPQAVAWSIHRNGVKLAWPTSEGVEVEEFPLSDLSLEEIRSRWGVGAFQIYWVGTKDGRRTMAGRSSKITLQALPGEEEGDDEDYEDEEDDEDEDRSIRPLHPALAPLQTVGSGANPLLDSLNLLTVITKLKNEEVKGSLDQVAAMQRNSIEMMSILVQRDSAKEERSQTMGNVLQAIREMAQVMTNLQAKVVELEQRAAQPAPQQDVDEDGIPIEPGDSMTDIAKAAVAKQVVRKLPEVLEGIAFAAKGYAEGKLEEQRQRQAQAAATAAAYAPRPHASDALEQDPYRSLEPEGDVS